ncbi:cupin domain-containing protein [Lysobacter sp. K5869]|uniref:cupin domain-containing protein n=1 Tax=Lysobacter sp. K5869 TaxID=2820808 RepID=UPI001C062047|nr:cupin domain-containing protein [Lysobacter sp. K5869]QWP78077.1 cupin domain-containing protein [Lysobacter sp. K5869]
MTDPRIVRRDELSEFYLSERCHVVEHWNSPDDAQASVARIRVAPGTVTQLHRLRGTAERYLIVQGRGRMEVEGLAPAEVGPGDSVFIPADAAQRIAALGDEELLFLAICTPRFVPECYQALEPEAA